MLVGPARAIAPTRRATSDFRAWIGAAEGRNRRVSTTVTTHNSALLDGTQATAEAAVDPSADPARPARARGVDRADEPFAMFNIVKWEGQGMHGQ